MKSSSTLLAAACAAALPGPAAGQIQTLLRVGDPVPGVGAVTAVYGVTVNAAGTWLAHVQTDNPNPSADQVILLDGAVYLREGDPLPGSPGFFTASANTLSLNAGGDTAWVQNVSLSPASSVHFNKQLVAREGDPVTAPGVSPGTTFQRFGGQAALNDARQILVLATMADATGSIWKDAIVRFQVDALGVPLSEEIVYQEGLSLVPWNMVLAANESGDAIFNASIMAVLLNDTVLAEHGQLSPVFGETWEALDWRADVGDGGDYAYTGSIGTGDALIWNGTVAARQGEVLAGFAPFELESVGFFPEDTPVYVDADGRLAWWADWNDPDTSRDSAIMRDHAILVQEGVSVADGAPLFEIGVNGHAYELSDDGRFLVFEARGAGGVEGVYLLALGPGLVETHLACSANPAHLSSSFTSPTPGMGGSFLLSNPQSAAALGFVGLATEMTAGPCGPVFPGLGEVLLAGVAAVVPAPVFFPGLYSAFVQIPATPALIGEHFFAQGLFLDATTPAEPLRLSDEALEVRIGSL